MKNLKRPKCPTEFSLGFARKLVRYLGGDPSLIEDRDCWQGLIRKYPQLIERAVKYFETAKEGDPSEAAIRLMYYGAISMNRAMRIIERAKTGYPAEVAFYLVHEYDAPLRWAMRIIERAQTGNPAQAARELCWGYGAPHEWANKIYVKWRGKERHK